MFGESQMNKFSFLSALVYIAVSLSGCSEGGSSSSTAIDPGFDKVPVDPVDIIPNETEETFVIVSINIADEMKVGESKSIQLTLESLELTESKLVYFEWQNLDGTAVNDGSLRPVKGIIRPQESSAQFSYEYTPEVEGTQIFNLVLSSENKKEIIEKIELSTEG